MSAYLVDIEHIDFMLTAAIKAEYISQQENMNALGQMLLDENKRSIDFRYDEENDAVQYTFVPFPLAFNRWDIDLALRGYRYQSCEHEGWDTSASRDWVEGFMAANKASYTAEDYQAQDDDDNRGWGVCVGYEWEENVTVPDYRAASTVE